MAVLTTIHPAPATTLMTPVIAIVIVVASAVRDRRGAKDPKRDPGRDPATTMDR